MLSNTATPDNSAPIRSEAYLTLERGCTLVAFLLPLKLSLTYIALVPLLLFWLYSARAQLSVLRIPPAARPIATSFGIFLFVCLLSGVVGVSATHSLPSLASLFFFALTIPLFANHARPKMVCLALIAGQSVAAFHSFIEASLPFALPKFFLGKVTESGQLAIVIPLALGVLISSIQNAAKSGAGLNSIPHQRLALTTLVITTALTCVGFQSELPTPSSLLMALTAAAAFCLFIVGRWAKRASPEIRLQLALTTISLPLLICALLVNLKRGPWLGVLVGASCLMYVYARRWLLPLVFGSAFIALGISPIRERLLASYDHFTIEGGRSTIWRIGAELLSEYPLGIGYHNSGILREFALEIPPELKHFHNNLLNIAAETGWLGLIVFIWFLCLIVKSSFRDCLAPLYVAIGAAIVSWQVAGLVEYNFGDSEVTIVIWVLMGVLLQREARVGSGSHM
ncbi:MAG: O-antigen ligase family protein [Pseudomonadota bacterium]